MTGQAAGALAGKVAFISGLARGQGRSHAVRLAREGADIIGFDICDQLPTVPYPMPGRDDLAETVKLVEAQDRRIVADVADVRDMAAVQRVFDDGFAQFGRVDVVVANAGIMPFAGPAADTDSAWRDAVEVMLTGPYHTIRAALPRMIEGGDGGSIIITSSTAGLKGPLTTEAGPLGYAAAKHGVVGLMRSYAHALGPHHIRVNTVHPTGVNTPMIVNETFMQWAVEHPEAVQNMVNAIPVAMVEPEDISAAIAWLASDQARYVTGVTLPVDAGFCVR